MNPHIPRFSDSEYQRRHDLVREMMRNAGIDCLLVPSNENQVYLTNITMMFFGVYLLFPQKGDPTLLADIVIYRSKEDRENGRPLVSQYWGAENSVTVEDSSVIRDMRGVLYPNFPVEIAGWIKERGYEHGVVGVVGREVEWAVSGGGCVGITGPDGLKSSFFQSLVRELPDVTFIDATGILREVRVIKSAEEMVSIRKGCRIADLCGEAMAEEMKRPGVREGDLFAAYWDTLYRNEGGWAWWFMACTNSTANPRDYGAHFYPYDYVLQDGDIFIAELVPEWLNGYAGHLDVSFVLGKPVQEAAYGRMNEVCLECYTSVVDCLRPGMTPAEILERGDEPIAKAGYRRGAPLVYNLGLYGMQPPFVGVPLEDPYWSERTPLRSGMVVNVISHVYDHKTNVCIRTGDTHVITDEGTERLNNPRFGMGLIAIRK